MNAFSTMVQAYGTRCMFMLEVTTPRTKHPRMVPPDTARPPPRGVSPHDGRGNGVEFDVLADPAGISC